MTVIDVKMAREGLVKAIEERGEDYVYQMDENGKCQYAAVVEGVPTPDCIVAAAINYIDPELFALLADEERRTGGMLASSISSIEMTGTARFALRTAQAKQDSGQTWGYALKAFDNYVGSE